MYEAVNNLYKVLIPVFENSRDFKKLASIHKQLYDSFCNIVKQVGNDPPTVSTIEIQLLIFSILKLDASPEMNEMNNICT